MKKYALWSLIRPPCPRVPGRTILPAGAGPPLAFDPVARGPWGLELEQAVDERPVLPEGEPQVLGAGAVAGLPAVHPLLSAIIAVSASSTSRVSASAPLTACRGSSTKSLCTSRQRRLEVRDPVRVQRR